MRQVAVMLLTSLLSLTFTGCEREDLHYDNPTIYDGEIDDSLYLLGEKIEGTWRGDLFVYPDVGNSSIKASFTDVCFFMDPYSHSSGKGYWVDYYGDNYWGGTNRVACHIDWKEDMGRIRIYFLEDDEYADIYNYSFNEDRFRGYILWRDSLSNEFELCKVSSSSLNIYSVWGYSIYKTADLLAGEWKGTMETDYIDSYSDRPTHKRYDDVTLVFQPFAEKAVNGTGKETICEQGKVVWRMPFKWHVDTLDAIVIKNDENVVMTAKKYELTSDIFNATFVSSDLLETAVYSLKRSSEP